MRTAAWILGLGLVLGLGSGALFAEEALTQDVITLKDGRVLKGQVVDESDTKVIIEIKGVKRSYSRSFIAGIDYADASAQGASAPPAPSAGTAPSAPSAPPVAVPQGKPQGSMVTDLAAHYSVPVSEVTWVQRQGIMDADLPMVFFIAATAGIVPGPVVRLRLAGWSWSDIEGHYGLEPDGIYFVAGPWFSYPFYRGHYYGWGGWHGGGRRYHERWR
jgi:hypothetical protein